jgi:hypothetical protein
MEQLLSELLFADNATLALYAGYGDEEFQANLEQVKLANSIEAKLAPSYKLELQSPVSEILKVRLKALAQQVLRSYESELITLENLNCFFASLAKE